MVIWIVGAVFVLVTVTLLCATKSKTPKPKIEPQEDRQPTDDEANHYRELEKVI